MTDTERTPTRGRASRARAATGVALTTVVVLGALAYSFTHTGNDAHDASRVSDVNQDGSPAQAIARATDGKFDYLADVAAAGVAADAPNVVIVHYDDLGYGDVGFMADTPVATPHLDSLAKAGVVLTNYHAPSAVCTPSRAGLLTGRLGPRANVPAVLFPSEGDLAFLNDESGASPLTQEEITLPDTLHAAGYTTSMIGKWHLGDSEGSLPTDFGFDSFVGSYFSHDMDPFVLYRDGDVVEGVDESQARRAVHG
ncbi:sulfatase-like hydrolase/transferase [Demequina litorisediminis]|uniref:sulfatase-like hydrolase/transferase n=1 Tax=Demequina litorisediminis TaxID=1849022 RepID=UPI0024E0ACA8|nr:sulfatase-like hydrolase/transferase [Demequina litorisediminis]